MLSKEDIKELKKFAIQIRIETLKEIGHLGFGHLPGAMSIVELLAVLYGKIMKINPQNPKWEERDWFILSKGHAGPSLYATLALKGYFPKDWLLTLNKGGTLLPSHTDKNLTPGIDMTTGSLGQGMSTALGVALGHKLSKKDNYVYVMLGDGETQEGQVWEGALYGGNAKIDNLTVFVDYNKQQLDGYTYEINDLGDLRRKWEDFGWYSLEIDGHDIEAIYNAIIKAKNVKNKSSVIILHTIKGKGVSFLEGKVAHHVKVKQSEIEEAIEKLEKELKTLEEGES
ncbi:MULTISPECIES: transketolase [unclassified Marinitoga]|uniref:transketolase n=1 Tax=unclassified Marinitoga TaxID=2640159 RepID=UPI000640D49E|nr:MULTISPECIES: transketolase [unclassified Marinitoga]KLO24603.1 carbohydrate degradation protein [Marinitoga sp. 1155]NUU98870.1 transketolase [Marinitoga sp. 1154]